MVTAKCVAGLSHARVCTWRWRICVTHVLSTAHRVNHRCETPCFLLKCFSLYVQIGRISVDLTFCSLGFSSITYSLLLRRSNELFTSDTVFLISSFAVCFQKQFPFLCRNPPYMQRVVKFSCNVLNGFSILAFNTWSFLHLFCLWIFWLFFALD